MIFNGLASLPDDSWFIRLSDNKEYFIHFDKQDDKEVSYQARKGMVGAAAWSKENGKGFIERSGANNLELVKVTSILKNDGTLN